MREALRRAIWLLPTVVVVSVLAFWVSARNSPPPPGEEGVPILFNPKPTRIQTLAWNAAKATASGGADALHAEQLLVRLGGAALPYLLPKLDSLPPAERRRVTQALMPIAVRMKVPAAAEVTSGEEAERFWVQFWQDHFVDFKPTITRRVVRRFGQRSTRLRRSELLRLDTFALDELVRQMGEADNPHTVRRLAAAASHIADKPWTLTRDASARDVEQTIELWQAWWSRHRSKYVALQGIERLTSPLLETRYVLWLKEAARTRFGTTAAGNSALSQLLGEMPSTLLLLASGLLGGSALGLLLNALLSTAERRWLARLRRVLALAWLGIPLVLIVGYTTRAPAFFGALLVLLSGTALTLLHADAPQAPLRNITRQSRVAAYARANLRDILRTMAGSASSLLGSVFIVEFGLGLPGWGSQTIHAVLQRDLSRLMLLVIATSCLLGLVHVTAALVQRLASRFAGEGEL